MKRINEKVRNQIEGKFDDVLSEVKENPIDNSKGFINLLQQIEIIDKKIKSSENAP